jgi:SNARE associated Golgi protein
MTTVADCDHEFKDLPQSSDGLETEESSTTNVEEADADKNSSSFVMNSEDDSASVEQKTPWYCSVKFAVGLLLLGFIVFVIVDTATNGYVRDTVNAFLDWIEKNPIGGFFLFVVGTCLIRNCLPCRSLLVSLIRFSPVYMCATVLFIPGSILTLGAGFVFSMAFGLGAGVVLGTVSVFIGASFGAIIAFVLGRYLLKDQVSKLSRKYAIFQALNLALEANGLKIFLLLRCVNWQL